MTSVFSHINKYSPWILRITFVLISSFAIQLLVTNVQASQLQVLELSCHAGEDDSEEQHFDTQLDIATNPSYNMFLKNTAIHLPSTILILNPSLGIITPPPEG